MPGARTDYLLTRLAARLGNKSSATTARYLETAAGKIHVVDSATRDHAAAERPCIVLTPDGPNVVAHYAELIALLTPRFRVVCFDMPGFGLSLPAADYSHSLQQGAEVVLQALDQLGIASATLAFSCANGLYAVRAAQLAPPRIASLVLSQTPSLAAMRAWAYRMIPRPLRIPVAGQLISWLLRRKLAHLWYRSALPSHTCATAWQQLARQSFDAGGCFCLASVVQGLLRESLLAPLPDLQCTLIWGEQDRSHRATLAASLLECLPRTNIVRFADCGHFPDLEQPQRYAKALIAHMATLSSRSEQQSQ